MYGERRHRWDIVFPHLRMLPAGEADANHPRTQIGVSVTMGRGEQTRKPKFYSLPMFVYTKPTLIVVGGVHAGG